MKYNKTQRSIPLYNQKEKNLSYEILNLTCILGVQAQLKLSIPSQNPLGLQVGRNGVAVIKTSKVVWKKKTHQPVHASM